jgi:nucleobase:cation symporter-1, NCS1 family
MMSGINQMIGGIAGKPEPYTMRSSTDRGEAGITNGSDFSRYAKSPKHYVTGSIASVWAVGTFVS